MVAVSCLPCSYSKAWSVDDESSLYAWYKGDTQGDVGTNVTEWADSSGNSRKLLKGGTNHPVVSATLNGYKGVQFGENSSLTRSSFIDIDGQDFIFSVMYLDVDGDSESGALIMDLDAPTTGYGLFWTDLGVLYAITTGKDSGQQLSNNFLSSTDGLVEVNNAVHTAGVCFTVERIGDTVSTYANGVLVHSFTESVTSTGADILYMGSYNSTTNDSHSTRIYEAMWYAGPSLDSELRNKIEGYMGHKYGPASRLGGASGHKYKEATPWGRGQK
jgi:hypothetical protein